MPLTLYNTLTRREESFQPLQPGQVHIYCCGVTVYDYCHLGHARSYIAWDTIRRYLTWRGYQVRYVQNFTDIDDKILRRAQQEGSSMQTIADRYTTAYFEDMERLNVLKADAYPRATHTIDGIQRLIHELEQKNFAYAAGGDVYYAVQQNPDYGKLSGRKLEQMQAGASGRVEAVDPDASKKRHPFDFALWKAAKPEEPAWDSPWGQGRPGWHIECSAMVRDLLGDSIDIHVGGADLIFPHHENEIAQSEASTGKPLAKYWLHNGMVNVGGEKMSKSLGNFTTIRDLLDRKGIAPMVIRLFVLGANYRKPIDFTDESITAAQNGWNTLKEGLLFGQQYGDRLGWTKEQLRDFDPNQCDPTAVEKFQTAMDADFNTSGGLAVLFDLAKALRREGNRLVHGDQTETHPATLHQHWQTLVTLAEVLGLAADAQEMAPSNAADAALSDAAIQTLIDQRRTAKQAKDYAEADRIRGQLQDAGIALIDKPGGETLWRRA